MKFIAFVCLLILCVPIAFGLDGNLSANAGGEMLNSTDLQRIVANSSANLQSYRYMLEIDQQIEIFNLSGINNSSQVILTKTIGQGSFNQTSKSTKIVLASLVVPLGDEDNSSTIAVNEHLLNDTIFIGAGGNWTQMKLPIADLWSTQNKAEQQLELLNYSNITFIGIETIDGEDCYKINFSPDMEEYSKIVSNQLSELPIDMNLSQIFRNGTLEVIDWISKENYLLKKTQVNLAMNMTPQSLGVAPKGSQNQEISQLTNTTVIFQDYNEPVNIKLPAEAKTAIMQEII